MQTAQPVTSDRLTPLLDKISNRLLVRPEMVFPYAAFDDLMPRLFALCRGEESRLLVAGHISPEVAIAADKSALTPEEIFGGSPFSSPADALLKSIDRPNRIIYLANPNRISGANLGLTELSQIAQAVPKGYLIVDEHYFDFFGISAAPLLQERNNVAILRSFTASFGIASADSGYLVADPRITDALRQDAGERGITSTIYRTITATMEAASLLGKRLAELHDESLRIATALTKLGLQNRITSADFLLLRVADPTSVGNYLARYRVPVENLDGYPHLQKYMRYRIQSPLSNDAMIEACTKMPAEYFKLKSADPRPVTLKKSETEPETQQASDPESRATAMRRISVLEAITGRK